jgi:hypothetical protein
MTALSTLQLAKKCRGFLAGFKKLRPAPGEEPAAANPV